MIHSVFLIPVIVPHLDPMFGSSQHTHEIILAKNPFGKSRYIIGCVGQK